MSDMIRQDPDEMLEISAGLVRLCGAMDELYMELQLARYRMPESAYQIVSQEIERQSRRMLLAIDRGDVLRRRVLWALEEFVRCERELTAQTLSQEAEMAASWALLPRKQSLTRE